MLRKCFASFLIALILITSLPVMSIASALEEYIVKQVQVAAVGETTINLTGLATGADASHTHIYEREYDDNYHWEECWICRSNNIETLKGTKTAHNKVRTGYSWGYASCYPGNNYTIYCADGCGYSLTTKDECVYGDEYTCIPIRSLHYRRCINCNVWKAESCIDASGQIITCENNGECVVCKHNYTTTCHYVTNNGHCTFCGKQFIQLINSSITYSADNSSVVFEWRLKGVNGGQLTGNAGWYSPVPATSKVHKIIQNATNDYTYQYTITFSPNVQDAVSANFDSSSMLTINGVTTHFSGWSLSGYYDHTAPVGYSISASGNGTSAQFSTKATITASVRETFSDTLQMRLLDSNGTTVLANWGAAVETSDIFTRTFDVVAEIKTPATLYVESMDKMGNTCRQAVNVQYIDSKAPILASQTGNTTNWSTSKKITYNATDQGIGQVQIAFNNQSDFALANGSGNTYSRTYNFVGDVYGTVTGALYLKDGLGNIRTAKVAISNIDNTKPTIVSTNQVVSSNKKSSTLSITSVHDENATLKSLGRTYVGSGVAGYAITKNTTVPTSFQNSNTFTVTENGTYYLWAKDNAGNVSQPKAILVKDIVVDVKGNITWNDENNKYASRANTILRVYGTVGTTKVQLGQINIVAGQTSYTLQVRQVNDAGQAYNIEVMQEKIPGYETIISGSGYSYNITNNLITPKYTSNVTMLPVDSFENKYLKNAQVEIIATIQALNNNRDKAGLHSETVTLQIDSGIIINKNSIEISYIDKDNVTRKLTNYTISGNKIIATFESNKTKDITAGDTLKIRLLGTLNELKQYTNTITYSGLLRDFATGANTNINLGEVTKASSSVVTVENQLPEANIQIKKTDSITEQILTDAEFTLYEWNGTNYIVKEIIKDENKDGIYQSNVYRWNSVTEGKYKIVETKLPQNHKDSAFSMEYSLNELKNSNYTVNVDYDNSNYTIIYGKGNPDNFDKVNGTVENEPYKLKAKIVKIDKETQNIIQSNGEFTIYEWNKETQNYEEYISYTNGQKVKMERQEDKTYMSGEWLYYTQKNEGKYRIIEKQAPEGYFGDYEEEGKKYNYDIDLLSIIANGKYSNQSVANEGTIILEKVEETGKLENIRVKAETEIHVLDSESMQNVGQADSIIEGAVYGLYAYENIYHSDGITTRYPEEEGLLYKKDELIMTKITNSEGVMHFEDLECGIYYIKMITAPEGYLKDENSYAINLSYQGENIEKVVLVGRVDIQVKKQAFQIYKLKENLTALNNAGFSLYLISDLSIVKTGKITRVTSNTYKLNDETAKIDERLIGKENEDGTYNLEDLIDYYYKIYINQETNASTLPGDDKVYNPYDMSKESYVKDYKSTQQGEYIQEIRTDSNGYLKSTELAYGEYIVIESSVPREQDVAKPFIVMVDEDSRNAQDIRFIVDNDFKTRVKIYKKDKETKRTILNKNATYVIRNAETNELITKKVWQPLEGFVEYGTMDRPFETSENGYLITPMELAIGKYILEEIKAPEGYTLNGYEGISENGSIKWEKEEKLRFNINTNTAYYTDSYLGKYVIVINQENKSVVGTIKIKASTGEFLTNAEKVNEQYEFNYETRPVENSTYKLCAKEDIYTLDNQGELLYAKDQIVTYLTTDSNGEAIIENLPLGKYYLKQTEPPEGFSLKEEISEVELSYEGQEVPVVFREVKQDEIRQKLEIIIHNKDSETGEKRTGGKYELYTKEEISYIDAKGVAQTIPANEKIITLTSNDDGIIKISKDTNIDMPRGKYYLKEIEAPTGYVLQQEELEIDGTKEKIEEIILIEKDYFGTQTKLTVKEIDEYNKLTTGSNFEIRKKATNEVIHRWQTNGEEETFRKLETNVEYVIVETKPQAGYTTAQEVTFVIDEYGKLWVYGVEQEENVIIIQDYKTKIQIGIKDEITKQYTSGTSWQIIRKTEINGQEKEEIIVNWTTKGMQQQIHELPIGNYILRQSSIGENTGYVTNEDVQIEVKDTKELQIFEFEQKVSRIQIHIKDEASNQYTKGSVWQIIRKQEEQEEILRQWTQEEKAYETEKLPVGTYILRQVSTGENTGYVTNEEVQIEVKDTREIQIYELEQKISKIEIHIKDEDTKEYTKGSKWQIIKKTQLEGEEVEKILREWTLEGKVYETEKLPVGEYILRQVEIGENTGYVTNEDIKIEVKDIRELQVFNLEQKITKAIIKVTDEETKEKIPNLEILIVDKETGKIIAMTEEIGKDEDNQENEEEKDNIGQEKEDINQENEEKIKIKETEEGYYFEKIPVGEYILKEKTPEGYKEVKDLLIKIEDKRDIQVIKIENKRLIYDMQVEKELTSIIIDGEKKQFTIGEMQKIEIPESRIKTIDVMLEYVIRVTNVGETKATIGKIIDEIPRGFELVSKDWQQERGKAIWDASEEELNTQETKEVKITLKWENSKLNFGEKKNIAKLEDSKNPYEYKDKNKENDIAEKTIIFTIKTGEDTRIEIIKLIASSLTGLILISFGLIFIYRKKQKY